MSSLLVTSPFSRYTTSMTTRKLLFIIFTNEPCKRNHAFMHALELDGHGHRVRMILEGDGTRCLAEQGERFVELFDAAVSRGILSGACKTASAGCATTDASRNMTAFAEQKGVPLLDGMDGHASVGDYVDDGFELVIY